MTQLKLHIHKLKRLFPAQRKPCLRLLLKSTLLIKLCSNAILLTMLAFKKRQILLLPPMMQKQMQLLMLKKQQKIYKMLKT
jgi:hypothetical protein